MKSTHKWLVTAFAWVVAGAGCSSGTDEATPRISVSSDELATMPDWLRPMPGDFGCGAEVENTFAGRDSAHGYTLHAKSGVRYTLDFEGTYAAQRGAALAIYDARTGLRVRADEAAVASSARVTFTPGAAGDYVIGAFTLTGTGTAPYALRVVCERPGLNDRSIGDTEFTSYEETWPDVWRFAKAAATGEGGAPEGRVGPVEEADIYKIQGTRVLYLNTYRGFIVVDAANRSEPRVIGRLPLFGQPIEMFVEGNVVHALVSDTLRLTQTFGAKPRFERRNASQLVTIDITNPTAPRLLQAIDIAGQLEEGVSRKVEDTIYVVSSQHKEYWTPRGVAAKDDQAWVYSFDVSVPAQTRKVQELEIFHGGSVSTSTGGSSSGRYFNDVKIAATSNALLVAENWQTYERAAGSPYDCGTSTSQEEAVISIIDISDPKGSIRRHARFQSYGRITDQFKQTYDVDPRTKKATYYGIFARDVWRSADCRGERHVENAIEAWDVTNGEEPKLRSTLSFGKPDEVVRGSLFDLDRDVVYAITARQIDPLYAIDLRNPDKLRIASAVDGLSGEMSVFRFIGDKKFLLGVGTDQSEACKGFDSPSTGMSTRLAASIIDVADLSKIRLVQRQCVTVENASWMGSEITWNLDQAHKVIGVEEEPPKGLITVPVFYWRQVGSGTELHYRTETAVGLMGFDLSQYQPRLAPEKQHVLENLSTSVEPIGRVRRAAIFHMPPSNRRQLLNIARTGISFTDINDPRRPVSLSALEIAPNESDVIRYGNYAVVQVSPSWEEYDPYAPTEFRVKPIAADMSSVEPVASITVARVERVVQHQDALVVFHRLPRVAAPNAPWEPDPIEALIFDMKNPARPRRVAAVPLPIQYVPWGGYHAAESAYVLEGEPTALVVLDQSIVILAAIWDTRTQKLTQKLVTMDLTNHARPVVREVDVTPNEKTQLLGLVADEDDSSVFLASRVAVGTKEVDGHTLQAVKYYAEHWMPRREGRQMVWAKGTSTNVPGRIFSVVRSDDHATFLAQEPVLELMEDGNLRQGTRLTVAAKEDAWARLTDMRTFFGKAIDSVVVERGLVAVTVSDRFYWRTWDEGRIASDRLGLYLLADDKLAQRFFGEIGLPTIRLLGASGTDVFVNVPGDGIVVLHAQDPYRPIGQSFVHTLGWQSSVELAGDVALIPGGHYGIDVVDLRTVPSLPVN